LSLSCFFVLLLLLLWQTVRCERSIIPCPLSNNRKNRPSRKAVFCAFGICTTFPVPCLVLSCDCRGRLSCLVI
jgi:hypothetical protein